MRVVATAGHVDHGKSTLVRAVTGTDPDRLAEEKARGLTIDLGFAWATLPSGSEIGFVDVPGHGRFLKNMLAGVGAVDACLFVVAATEGWKAQSEEHLRILEVLGISRGMVALTKVAGLDDESRMIAVLDLNEHLSGTFLAGAEVVEVDVPAGEGLQDLVGALDRLVGSTPPAPDVGRPRLWVDRAFPIKGAGTVVTGTLVGGRLRMEEEVGLQPGGLRARVRGLQSHHSRLEAAEPGRRLAVNLAGVSHDEVRRGQALVRPGQWHLCRCLDATVTVLAGVDHTVTRRGAYAVHLGSAEVPVRLRLLGSRREVLPGDTAMVRIWLAGEEGLPLVPGDRYVLRESGRNETVGGGEVLDVDPVVPAGRANPSRSVERVVAERGWVRAADLERLTGVATDANVGAWVVSPSALDASRAELAAACREAGEKGVDLAGLGERHRALLVEGAAPGLRLADGRAYDADSVPEGPSPTALAVLGRLEASPWSPPTLPLSERGALRELERHGLAVETGPIWFSAAAVDRAVGVLWRLLERSPAGFTVAEARDALGVTRKHALPLLEHLDRKGVTRRVGDMRVGGPRMPGSGQVR